MMSSEDPKPIRRVSPRKYRGLGDVVAAVAQPVAKVIDKAARTNLEGCAGCAKRRRALNGWVPFGSGDG